MTTEELAMKMINAYEKVCERDGLGAAKTIANAIKGSDAEVPLGPDEQLPRKLAAIFALACMCIADGQDQESVDFLASILVEGLK
jgi:hypothetical protein